MSPRRAASDGMPTVAKESEQTGSRHRLHVAYIVTNMEVNINKTVPRTMWNITNENQHVE